MTRAVVACGALALHVRGDRRAPGLGRRGRAARRRSCTTGLSGSRPRVDELRARHDVVGRLRRLRHPRRARRAAAAARRRRTATSVFARHAASSGRAAGTYYLTDFLVRTFDHIVVRGLGLDRYPELRDDYFRHYTRVVWLAQRPTPTSCAEARSAPLRRSACRSRCARPANRPRTLPSNDSWRSRPCADQRTAAVRDPRRGPMQELDRGWRRIVSELGDRLPAREARDGVRGRGPDRSRASSSSSIRTGSSSRSRRRRASSTCRRATRSTTSTSAGSTWRSAPVYGCPFVRRGNRAPRGDVRGLREPREARAVVPAARHAGRDDLRAERQAARLAPPRHGLRADDALRQAVHGLGHVRSERARHDRDGGDGVRPRVARGDARDHLADQRQLAAALRRPDALGAARVRAREPGAGHHAVPADGRDVAGVGRRLARAAGRGGARGHRARADDPARLPGGLRVVPLEHRHAVRLAELRHAGVGDRPALHRARSRATTACRSAAAAR